MSEETQPLPEVPAKKKGGSKLLLLFLIALVVGGGGGGAWWFLRAAPAKPAEGVEHEVDISKRGVLAFEPFLVNLADKGGGRFLKTTVQVVVPEPHPAEHFKEKQVLVMQARSAILELLTVQTADALVTPDGKKALKETIKEKVSHALGVQVLDVLFSEFVVQF